MLAPARRRVAHLCVVSMRIRRGCDWRRTRGASAFAVSKCRLHPWWCRVVRHHYRGGRCGGTAFVLRRALHVKGGRVAIRGRTDARADARTTPDVAAAATATGARTASRIERNNRRDRCSVHIRSVWCHNRRRSRSFASGLNCDNPGSSRRSRDGRLLVRGLGAPAAACATRRAR